MPLAILEAAVLEGVFPGAAFALGRDGQISFGTVGKLSPQPGAATVQLETLWDLASLTKVVCTTTLAALSWETGRLALDSPVQEYLPEFAGSARVRDLLLHRSGLAAFHEFHKRQPIPTRQQVLDEILGGPAEPAGDTVYSDLGFITLGLILERIEGLRLEELFAQRVAGPLGLDAGFRPEDRARCAPTETREPWREAGPEFLQGEVHDPTCALLGGVAGHAGLFANVRSVAKFAQGLVECSLLKPGTMGEWTLRQGSSSRALGWDTNWEHASSAGTAWPEAAFGHTGFTGTSLWVSLEHQAFAVLLTNRVCPTAENRKILELRPRFHEAAAASLGIESGTLRASV